MKVLHIQKVKGIAGSEKYLLDILPRLNENGFECAILSVHTEHHRESALQFVRQSESAGIKTYSLEIKSDKQVLKIIRFIKRLQREHKFDLHHSHLIHADLWSALVKRSSLSTNYKLVSTKHGYYEGVPSDGSQGKDRVNTYTRICRFAEKSITRSFAVSEGIKTLFLKKKICTPDAIDVIHHGYDTSLLYPTKKEVKYDIIMVGRYAPYKGHDLFIESLVTVEQSYGPVHTLFLGSIPSEFQEKMNNQAKALGLQSTLEFGGHVDNVLEVINQSTVQVAPSREEGFGLVVLDGFAARTPVIAFDISAINEIIQHERTGLLATPLDTVDLGNQICKALKDQSLRETMCEQAQESLLNYFSLDRVTQDTIAFYNSVLKQTT